MDGIRKKIIIRPQPISEPLRKESAVPRQLLRKKEELFISKDESEQMEKHEKSFHKGLRTRKIIWTIIIVILLLIFAGAIFIFIKTYLISKKMNSQQNISTNFSQDVRTIISPIIPQKSQILRGQETGRINILLLGAAGQNKPGGNLTDTVMIASIDLHSNKIAFLSLPRDFYVTIADSNSYAKINSLYPIGIKDERGTEYIKKTVEKITGITLHYYLVVDFEGFEKIIDDIGGINIISERDIYDDRYPGPNYSYKTFALSKGLHRLDGETALMYARERHDDPEGDFGRAKRQQQIIQAVKNKFFSAQTLFNVSTLNNILNTLGDNIKTDIAFNDIESFIQLTKKLDTQNITNSVVDAWKKDSLLKVSHVQVGNVSAFILIPRVGNYSEIQELAQNIFNLNELKKRQEEIAQEKASIKIFNASGDNALTKKIQTLLQDKLDFNNVSVSYTQELQTPRNKTVIIDHSGGAKIFTLDELVKKLPAEIARDFTLQEENADIIIILGSDLTETYKFDEDSAEDFKNSQEDQNIINFTKTNR